MWNLVGMTLPLVVAIPAIRFLIYGAELGPVVLHGLGKERFGVLTLVWMLVGYFGLFDLGLGRALTKMMAEYLALKRNRDLPGLFWTALSMMCILGVAAGCLVALLSPPLAGRWLQIADELRREAMLSFLIAACGMPIVILSVGLVGVLEASRQFRRMNFIRSAAGILVFAGPLLALPFTNSLCVVVAVLTLVRCGECAFYFICCLRVLPVLRGSVSWSRSAVRPLLGFGSWMTVTELTVPLMVHADRFLIGMLRSMAAVAFYVTPAEVVIKLLIVPRAWVSVLFPTFVSGFTTERSAAEDLLGRGVKILMLILFPVVLVVIAFAPEALHVWLGPVFARNSSFVMRCLTLGVFLLGMARVPLAFVQSAGRPDLSAKAHLVQLPLYLALACGLISAFGIRGAALAWLIRVTVDLGVMLWLAARLSRGALGSLRVLCGMLALGVTLLAGVTVVGPAVGRLGGVVAAGIAFYAAAWRYALSPVERTALLKETRALLHRCFRNDAS